MKKATLFIMLIVFTLALGLLSCVSADAITETIEMVEKTNAKIEAEIEKAVEAAAVEDADVDKIVDKIFEKTEKIADKMVIKAAENGVLVEKTYIPVQFGDQTVMIDPCRVVGN